VTPTARRALLFAAALVALPAHADEGDDVARLREEAAALRQSLERLEAKIRALENANPQAPAPAAPANAASAADKPAEPSLVSMHRQWSQVQPGLPKERVTELLGEPEKILRINGDLVWYYVYPSVGRGSVFFNAEDKVSAVQAPRVGLF
jgi:SmpA / OmlA family